jgi:hypothetical protein
MKWMRERDLLIAQTMAFVQSVTGKTPDTEEMVTASVAPLSVETSEIIRSETTRPAAALSSSIASLLRKTPPAALAPAGALAPTLAQAPTVEVSEETSREIPRPAPLARPDLREDFQSEIRARVASFRAHQERFNREREAYCTATMAKVHAALKEAELPPQLGK